MSLSQTVTYDNQLDFTFDNTKIEMLTSAKLKKLTYPGETLFVSYHASIDGWRGDGVLTGTAFGGASISGGKLDLKGNTIQYVRYESALNVPISSVGTYSVEYIPNYTGLPATERYVFAHTEGVGLNNVIEINQRTDGRIWSYIYDSSGVSIAVMVSANVFPATAGVPIHIELDLNLAGTTRLFVNGALEASTANTGTRNEPAYLYVGTNRAALTAAECEIGFVQLFSTVKHTAAFTPAGEPYDYDITNPAILVNSTVLADGLLTLSEFANKTGLDDIKYTVFVGGQDYYWTGVAWADSNGTYAQANDAATINANSSTLVFPGGNLQGKAFLHSNDGYSTPELISNTYTYSFFVSETAPNKCIVYGWVKDAAGDGVAGKTITIKTPAPFFHGENLIKIDTSTATNSEGYWEISLVETATIAKTLLITVDGSTYSVTIPDATSAALSSLA